MSAAEVEAVKQAAGASGWLTIREFATLAGISEGSTRAAVREGKLDVIRVKVDDQERVFISPVEVLVRHLPALLSTSTRDIAIEQLRLKAQVAGVQLDLDEVRRSIQTLLGAVNAKPAEQRREAVSLDVASSDIQTFVAVRE